MLGFAFQKGAIPLSLEALLRAIEINGAAIEMNKLAFTWGRLAAHDMSRVRSVLQFKSRASAPTKSLDDVIATRAEFLTGYQDTAYADRYLAAVAKVRKAESTVSPASTELTEAVAKNLFKLMAYKDEYEVARLYTDGSFAKKVSEKFDGDFTLKYHLAPPIFAQRDKTTGHLQKKEFGGWMIHVFRVLARLKFLRGGAFDPFGRTEERRLERRLIADYEARVAELAEGLSADKLAVAVAIANVPAQIRGFGHVKLASLAIARARESELLNRFDPGRYPRPTGPAVAGQFRGIPVTSA
jgi:indolepyruvate ferredoxin oxidoreductase